MQFGSKKKLDKNSVSLAQFVPFFPRSGCVVSPPLVQCSVHFICFHAQQGGLAAG